MKFKRPAGIKMPAGLMPVEDFNARSREPKRGEAWPTLALAAILTIAALTTLTGETSPVQGKVPQRILDPILNKAAALAKVGREQLVIARAEPVVWNDGSLGCPEPGMMYTQALVNGYWVVIEAAGQTYDFRVDARGRSHLCPAGRGRPPRQSNA